MKKKLSIVLALAFCLVVTGMFTGCVSVYDYEDMSEYITLGEYKGLEYDKSKLEVSDQEIQDKIDQIVSGSASTKEITEGAVENGDTVVIDYVGTIDGEEFDGGSATDASLTIGSGQFIDGFESGLVGKNIGDTVSLDLKFPDDYNNADVAGKDVNFQVKINKKTVTETPTFNEEWVKENTDYSTIDEYKEYIKGTIVEEKKAEVGNSLIESLVKKADIKGYPEKEGKLILQSLKLSVEQMAMKYNVSVDEVYKQYGATSEEDFESVSADQVKQQEGTELVVYYIARNEGLVASSEDVDKYYENFLKENSMTEEKFEEAVGESLSAYKSEHSLDLQKALTQKNVATFLVDNGKAN